MNLINSTAISARQSTNKDWTGLHRSIFNTLQYFLNCWHIQSKDVTMSASDLRKVRTMDYYRHKQQYADTHEIIEF